MKIKSFEENFSQSRLHKYKLIADNNWKKTIAIYRSNLRLSQAFYPLLSLVEISLRNSINNHFKSHFSDPNWLITQKDGFMNDPRIRRLPRPFVMRKKILYPLSKFGPSITNDKLVSELSFGFWSLFFERNHYRVLSGAPIKIFKSKPKNIGRNKIYATLNNIRKFRNRVYHYEHICFSSNSIDLSQSEEIHKSIYSVLSWFDSDLVEWANFERG